MSKWRNAALLLLAAAWAFAIARALAGPEPLTWFTYHMSFHEKWYPGVLRGEIVDRWLPPGFVWAVKLVPAPPVVAFRLVSIAASLALVATVWRTTKNQRLALLLASSPLLIIFGARAQPDALMLALSLGGLLAFKQGGRPFLGGLLIGLSAFVKPVGLLALLAARPSWRWLAGVALGAVPFGIWLAFHPASILLHAGKSAPLEDILRLAIVAPLAMADWFLLRPVGKPWRWATVFTSVNLAFAALKAPLAHEYYLLPGAVGNQLRLNVQAPRYWMAVALNAGLALAGGIFLGVVTW